MLAELFILWTLPFWILCVLSTFIMFAFVHFEKTLGATITLVATIALIGFINRLDPITYARTHPWEMVGAIALYVVIGIAWSIYRWYVFLLKQREQIQKIKLEFLRKNLIEGNNVPDNLKEKWLFHLLEKVRYSDLYRGRLRKYDYDRVMENFISQHANQSDKSHTDKIPDYLKEKWAKEVARVSKEVQFAMRPRPRDHKGLITLWMMYWPWSLAWYMVNDPIVRFFRWIYRRIQGLLEKISQHVWKDVEKDLPSTDDL